MVTVAELILRLQAFHPEARVVVAGYEGGYDDIGQPTLHRIAVNETGKTSSYWGKHEEAPFRATPAWREEDAVLIGT